MNEYSLILLKITELYDKKKQFSKADNLMRFAFDPRKILENYTPLGEGVGGKYFTNFNEEDLNRIRSEIGSRVDKNIGIKAFHYRDDVDLDEYVLYHFILPIIDKHTTLKVPNTEHKLPLSQYFQHQTMVIEHMPGVHVRPIYFEDYLPEIIILKIQRQTEIGILQKLQNIGLIFGDIHRGNWNVPERVMDKIAEDYKNSNLTALEFTNQRPPSYFDLSDEASIFDFGFMQFKKGSIACQEVERMKEVYEKRQHNDFAKAIYESLNRLCV